MRPHLRQKNGEFIPKPSHLTLHQGGLAQRETARRLVDRAQRDIAVRCKRDDVANSTAYPSRAVAEMAQGSRQPLRVICRIISDEIRGGGPLTFGLELAAEVATYTMREAAEQGRVAELAALNRLDVPKAA